MSTNSTRHVVAIEGLIGAGKSTLCDKLVEAYPDYCSVYREHTNEKLLALFYSDAKKYALALQLSMLKMRRYQWCLAERDSSTNGDSPRLFLWDRSMLGDYIFAYRNHLDGAISRAEMDAYELESIGTVHDVSPFVKHVDLFVLLDDEPRRCKERVDLLRCNESEKGIPLSYYEGLDDLHFYMFLEIAKRRGGTKIAVVPWEVYNDAPNALRLIKERLERFHSPRVSDVGASGVAKLLASSSPTRTFCYESADAIESFYKCIQEGRDAANGESSELILRGDYIEVLVPSDIMRTNEGDSSAVPTYENAYKRVVLWHLARDQAVYFFTSKS